MNNFPYPVLTDEGSAYKNEIFHLEYLDNSVESDCIRLQFKIDLSSNVLCDFIESGRAHIILKAYGEVYSKIECFKYQQNKYSICFSKNQLRSSDVITITAYVIASKKLDYCWNNELLEIYPENMRVELNTNDVLAVSNREKLDYSDVNKDFIKFKVLEEMDGKGFSVNLSAENYIEIKIGRKFSESYQMHVKNGHKAISAVFGSNIVYEALLYTVLEVVQHSEDYCEKEWYRLLGHMIQSVNGQTIEEFAEDVTLDSSINMDKVCELCNALISNRIEESIIETAKRGEAL